MITVVGCEDRCKIKRNWMIYWYLFFFLFLLIFVLVLPPKTLMFVWLYFISSGLYTGLYTIYLCNDCFCNSVYDVTFSAYAVIKS